MQALAIITIAVLAAIFYGVLHDQVTARICLEYFTIGHPQVLPPAAETPTSIGLVWGVIATWWMGAALGIIVALAARLGGRPKATYRDVLVPLAVVLVVSAVCACAAGAVGNALAKRGVVVLLGPIALRVPAEQHVGFITCLWAHSASYLVSGIGGLVIAWWVWRQRGRRTS